VRAWYHALAGLLFAQACGVQQVELSSAQAEIILLDDVSTEARNQLRHTKPGKMEPRVGLLYPADRTAVPANVSPLTFLFVSSTKGKMEPMRTPMKDELLAFELHVEGADGDLFVYTTQPQATLPLERWRKLLSGQAGGELKVTVRALTAAQRVLESPANTLRVRAATKPGQLSYWSDVRGIALTAAVDDSQEGIREGAAFPSLDPWTSLSADGERHAVARAGLLSIEIGSAALPIAWAASEALDYPAWSPDGSALVLVSGQTVSPMEPTMPKPMAMQMAMPASNHGSLVRVTIADGRAEPPEAIFHLDKPDESLRAPTFSLDGGAIAFELLKGAELTGELWIWNELSGARERVNAKLAWDGHGSFPGFIPSTEPREQWLVFSQALAPGDEKLPEDQLQLWCIGLVERDDGTLEPAGEPYWVPAQRVGDSNRRALFSP
jgi:hypothetical protein